MKTDDFLQIIDFVKNDDKYTSRIKQLQDAENSLKEKLAVAKSVDEALKAKDEAEQEFAKVVKQGEDQAKKYAERAKELELQYDKKVKQLDEKWEKLADERDEVQALRETALAAVTKAEETLSAASAKLADANSRLDNAKLREFKTQDKLARLKAIAEE